MLAIGVNYKWDACPRKGSNPSTGPPTYQIIKVTNANHMSVMKTSLMIIPMCPQECFALYKSSSRFVLCYKKDLLHLITRLSVTDNFSACREYLTKNCLSFPSDPRWVRHSYLSKRATVDRLCLWVIKAIFWCCC